MKLTLVIPVYISDPLHLDFTRQTLESIHTHHSHQVILVNNFCKPEFETELSKLTSTPEVSFDSAQDAHTSGVKLVNNPSGNILAASWNLGMKLAFNQDGVSEFLGAQDLKRSAEERAPKNTETSPHSDYCLIINNDIILHPQAIDNLVAFAQKHPEFLLWSASEWANARTLAQAKLTSRFSPHPHFSCFMVSPKTIETVGWFDEKFSFGYFEDNDYHTRILLKGFQAAATDSAKFYHYGSRTINVDDNLKIEGKYHYQLNRAYFKKKWGLDIHGRAFDPPEAILKEIHIHPPQ